MHLKRHAIRANRVMLVCPDVNCGAKFSTKPQIIKHIHAHHPHVVEIQYSKGEIFMSLLQQLYNNVTILIPPT